MYSRDSMWTRERVRPEGVQHVNGSVEIDRLRSALTRILAVDRLPACARNIARDALAVQVTP